MKRLLLAWSLLAPWLSSAQVTWSDDVANILYTHCTSCHNPNGIAPFSLIEYSDASLFATGIQDAVLDHSMPPWTADTTYKRYLHERLLSAAEIDLIVEWVQNGKLQGDLNNAPPPPVFTSNGILNDPDLVVQMPTYTSKAVNDDDYVCIAVPSGLTSDKKIRAVEVIPGDKSIVHHVLVFIDPSATYQSDTLGGDCGGPTTGYLVTTYAPGGQPTVFPNGGDFKTGISMPAGSNVILAMHYPEGSNGMKDSTEVHFFFHDDDETNVREIYADRLVENWSFCIPANQTKEVVAAYPSFATTTNSDLTLLSILPHMHLLGQQIKGYAVLPTLDTLPLVHIPKWDFEWQDAYFFKKPQVIPSGSRLHGEGFYDNTSNNPNNPNDPPINVCAGLNTSDEMFLFYYHYMDYQAGDETINLDSLLHATPSGQIKLAQGGAVSCYPNPSTGSVSFEVELSESSAVGISIYNQVGQLVRTLDAGSTWPLGTQHLTWDGRNGHGAAVPDGVYFYSLRVNGKPYAGRLVMMRK